jgi:hypothetical protein
MFFEILWSGVGSTQERRERAALRKRNHAYEEIIDRILAGAATGQKTFLS